jgi:hypothetical protein
MLQNARQHLEKRLRRLVQQWDDTKQKLRALARQTRQEQRYQYGKLVELAGLVHIDAGTLLGGLCELATMITDRERALRWKALGDVRLAEHYRHRAHRKRSALLTVEGMLPGVILEGNKPTQT